MALRMWSWGVGRARLRSVALVNASSPRSATLARRRAWEGEPALLVANQRKQNVFTLVSAP
ncbi:MAG: hypothetical protein AAGA48_28465 [Myxococcota bacterium]